MSGLALPVMAHLVAGWPNFTLSYLCGMELAALGASYLELQFPFSDPSADGPAIEDACAQSLAAGFSVDGGFELASRLCADSGIPLFIMCYASLVHARGAHAFCRSARGAGASGIIVPDLCPGSDDGLYEAAAANDLAAVPVLAPGMGERRTAAVLAHARGWVYVTLRTGITGRRTELGETALALLSRAGVSGHKVLAGFGVQEAGQLRALRGKAHAAVVGSHLCRAIGSCLGPDGSMSQDGEKNAKALCQALANAMDYLRESEADGA